MLLCTVPTYIHTSYMHTLHTYIIHTYIHTYIHSCIHFIVHTSDMAAIPQKEDLDSLDEMGLTRIDWLKATFPCCGPSLSCCSRKVHLDLHIWDLSHAAHPNLRKHRAIKNRKHSPFIGSAKISKIQLSKLHHCAKKNIVKTKGRTKG